jgi:hypothetical protein
MSGSLGYSREACGKEEGLEGPVLLQDKKRKREDEKYNTW